MPVVAVLALSFVLAQAAPQTGAQLHGSAFVQRNLPAVGAVVFLDPVGAEGLLRLTTIDTKGRYRFDGIEGGRYRVSFRRDGLKSVVREGVELKGPFRSVLEVTMEPGAEPAEAPAPPVEAGGPFRIEGRVSVGAAGSVGEVRIRFAREDASEDPRTTVTAPDGAFAVDGVRGGRWRVTVAGAGFLPIRATVTVWRDRRVEVTLVPQPANFEGAPEDLMPVEEPVPPRR